MKYWILRDGSFYFGIHVSEGATEITEAEYLARPVPVPQQVPIRKAKQLLIDRDKYDIVHNHIMSLPGKAGRKAQMEWIESSFVERYRPLTLSMFALIGVNTEAERDQWFIDGNAYP